MHRDLETLCQSCGLCCDGSLFGRVDLEPAEVLRARRNHLHVIGSGKAFEQPCAALRAIAAGADERRTCSIYGERPLACRRFTCRLHDRHRREGGPLEPRLAAVRRVRELLAGLEASRRDPGIVVELKRRLEEDFARA
jgi:Fe-S-cluster containining protein